MSHDPQRRQVIFEAARLLYARAESQYFRAKMRAAWRVYGAEFRQADLPSDREIREQILQFARADHRELLPESLGRLPDFPRLFDEEDRAEGPDRFCVFAMLLQPLEKVKESLETHPEGDLLYHSLQVFTLARQELPYDEEFLLAALLHDVGKPIDPRDHAAASVDALEGFITARTAWLIAHHVEAQQLADRTLGARSRRRLQASENFEELMLLARCDREGRQVGVRVPDVEDALQYIRDLADMCGE